MTEYLSESYLEIFYRIVLEGLILEQSDFLIDLVDTVYVNLARSWTRLQTSITHCREI